MNLAEIQREHDRRTAEHYNTKGGRTMFETMKNRIGRLELRRQTQELFAAYDTLCNVLLDGVTDISDAEKADIIEKRDVLRALCATAASDWGDYVDTTKGEYDNDKS